MRNRSSLDKRTEAVAQEALQRANDSDAGGGPASIPVQLRYVAQSGSDATGNGSFAQPFATITAAMASITDAASAKRYVIMVAPGTYAAPTLKSFVSVEGVDPSDKPLLTGALSVAGFGANAGTGVANCIFAAAQAIDFGATASPVLNLFNNRFLGTLALGGTNATNFVLKANRVAGACTINDCSSLLTEQNNFEAATTVAAPAENVVWESAGDSFRANLAVSATAPNTLGATAVASQVTSTLTLTGAGVTYSGTAGAIPTTVTLAGGASSPVALTGANGLRYTAAVVGDWTNTNPSSIANALDRIAAKITPIA